MRSNNRRRKGPHEGDVSIEQPPAKISKTNNGKKNTKLAADANVESASPKTPQTRKGKENANPASSRMMSANSHGRPIQTRTMPNQDRGDSGPDILGHMVDDSASSNHPYVEIPRSYPKTIVPGTSGSTNRNNTLDYGGSAGHYGLGTRISSQQQHRNPVSELIPQLQQNVSHGESTQINPRPASNTPNGGYAAANWSNSILAGPSAQLGTNSQFSGGLEDDGQDLFSNINGSGNKTSNQESVTSTLIQQHQDEQYQEQDSHSANESIFADSLFGQDETGEIIINGAYEIDGQIFAREPSNPTSTLQQRDEVNHQQHFPTPIVAPVINQSQSLI